MYRKKSSWFKAIGNASQAGPRIIGGIGVKELDFARCDYSDRPRGGGKG